MPNKRMTLEDLKRGNPGLYEAVIESVIESAVAEGVKKERARIVATLPEKPGSSKEAYAHECIRNGTPVTEAVKAQYLALTLQEVRGEDPLSVGNKIASMVEGRLGVPRDS